MVPVPPRRPTPPRMTAVTTVSTRVPGTLAAPDPPSIEDSTYPPVAAQAPLKTRYIMRSRSTGSATERPAEAFPPTA